MPRRSVSRRQDTVNAEAVAEGRRTPAGDALSELWVRVFQLDGLFSAAGDALARPAGQTSARWQVMAAIEDGPATVAQIARRLHLARQSVQRVADLLELDGISAYEDNPGHRRAKLVRLTGKGETALHQIQAGQRRWANALGARIGERDLRQASKVLARVLDTLATRSAGEAAEDTKNGT
jgi:DNA-binding MarR family transcriptional regulator